MIDESGEGMSIHEWAWCNTCDVAMVRCGACGNNCCNGGVGCAECKGAHYVMDHTRPPLWLRIREKMSNRRRQTIKPPGGDNDRVQC